MISETILEVKHTYFGERKEFQCIPLLINRYDAVVLYTIKRDGRIEDVDFPKGTHSIGYFWEDRFYNLYHWITPDGITLGLYYNIADQTRILPNRIEWRDLLVDILITPDGQCRVLDEDEIPSDMDIALKGKIEATRDILVQEPEKQIEWYDAVSKRFLQRNDFLK